MGEVITVCLVSSLTGLDCTMMLFACRKRLNPNQSICRQVICTNIDSLSYLRRYVERSLVLTVQSDPFLSPSAQLFWSILSTVMSLVSLLLILLPTRSFPLSLPPYHTHTHIHTHSRIVT